MIVARDLQATHQISNPAVRTLVEQRINDITAQGIAIEDVGYFLVVEPGDPIEALHAQVGFNILQNRFTGVRYDRPGFTGSFEFIAEFASCYDMVFVLDDSGMGVEMFVSKEEGIDADLIAMCRKYAYRASPEDAT